MKYKTQANGFFNNDCTKFINLDVSKSSPNRIGTVTDVLATNVRDWDNQVLYCATIQYRDLQDRIVCKIAEPAFSTYEINRTIRRRHIKRIMHNFHFSCKVAASFLRYHAYDKDYANHLHMSRTECAVYDFENLYLA